MSLSPRIEHGGRLTIPFATLLRWVIWGEPALLCYFRPVFTSLVGYIIVFFGVALQLWLSHLIWDHTLCQEETLEVHSVGR